jgi:hypothetical protein
MCRAVTLLSSYFQARQLMTDKCRRFAWLCSISVAVLPLCLSGCSDVFGPEQMTVTRVTGSIKNNGAPVKRGWIEFVPIDGTVGKICAGKIQADGSFEVAHVPVGMNLIRLANAPLGSAGAERLFGSYHSPIRRVVREQATEPVDIEILEEGLRYQLTKSEGASPKTRKSGDAR